MPERLQYQAPTTMGTAVAIIKYFFPMQHCRRPQRLPILSMEYPEASGLRRSARHQIVAYILLLTLVPWIRIGSIQMILLKPMCYVAGGRIHMRTLVTSDSNASSK